MGTSGINHRSYRAAYNCSADDDRKVRDANGPNSFSDRYPVPANAAAKARLKYDSELFNEERD